MPAHSPRDRSRSPLTSTDGGTSSVEQMNSANQNDTSNQTESTDNSKIKKENESQQRTKSLKSFIQTLINDATFIGKTYDEQMKALESASIREYPDISLDRTRRMIRNALKLRKSQSTSVSQSLPNNSSFMHKDPTNILSMTTDPFTSNENHSKKNRSNSVTNNSSTKTINTDLTSSSTLSTLDSDFLRHAFSQQYRPSLDLSAYFSAAAAAAAATSNDPTSPSSLFRPSFSPSNFLQTLTSTTSLSALAPPPPLPSTFASSHAHTNGTTDSSSIKSSKQLKISNSEVNSIKVLVNAYREAASYLCRSADELEQLL